MKLYRKDANVFCVSFHRGQSFSTDEVKLKRHCASAHQGQVSPTCNACKELQGKIDERK